MKNLIIKNKSGITKSMIAIFSVAIVLFCTGYIPFKFNNKITDELPKPKDAEAMYRYDPAVGVIVTGSTAPILGATSASAEGVNTGDWRGAEADDNFHWGITSTTSGYNAYFDFANVDLRGANKMIIQTEFDEDSTAPNTLIQICDWSSNVGVDNVADTQCTGGGWRTINENDVTLAPTSGTAYDFEIYDGYWASNATTKINTPLSNFIDSSGKTRVRFYSTTNTTTVVNIDYIRMFVVINPVYSAAGAAIISGGTPTGTYASTTIGGAGQTGSDNAYFSVPGTASVKSDFYLSFKGIKTYSGVNAILYRAEYSCSATGITIKPKIFNFNTNSWEDLTTANITCSTTDTTNAWAKSSISPGDYIQDGEVRIGWYGSAANVLSIRIDTSYIMIGTVNNGNTQITFGSNSAGTSANTRDLDMTGTTNTWNILSADESNTQSFASYGYDGDNDATVEEASAANMNFTVIPPINASITGAFFASRHMSGAAGTVQLGIGDAGGVTAATGGWTPVGSTGGTSLVYTDNIQIASVTSGGAAGLYTNPGNHVDFTQSRMNLRLRTTSDGATTNNSVAQWDFAMVSIQWIENVEHRTGMSRYDISNGVIVTGTSPAILGATAATTEGVNVGDWRGAEADDNLHWGITSTASGYNAYADITGVTLDGANSLIFQTEFDLDTTVPTTYVQVCDWVSNTGVNNAADTQCTGGGWRNLNTNDVGITTTTGTAYSWQIYDGYWNSNATTKISTPLTNFINGTGTVKVRYYSSVSSASSVVNIDYIRLFTVINPIYFASGATQLSGGTISGDYTMTTTAGAGQTGSDNAYFSVPGTASALSNFYLSYNNVKTWQGADTILYRAEYSCSATGINIKPKIYNFNSASWEDMTSGTIACSTTDTTNAWAKSGITMSNYVSGGEIRIGWYGSGNSTASIRLDMAYVMIGTGTNGTSQITYGSNSSGSAANTKTLDMTGTASTWNILSADESNTQGFAFYAYDNDADATVEEASAANMDFTLIPPKDTQVTGILFAGRYMSGAAGTVNIGIADAGGLISVQGGWTQVGANSTTALTYSDSITMTTVASGGHAGLYVNPYDYVDAETGKMNMRLRTSTDGATTNNSVAQWDFAMISLQWLETPLPPSTITFNISDSSIGFGQLSAAQSRYATGDGLGTTTPSVAHTITASSNSPGGYIITLNGNTLTYGTKTISGIGDMSETPAVGTEQFGLNFTSSGGYGTDVPLYGQAGYYAFSMSTPNIIAYNPTGDDIQTTYSASYLANIASNTAAGEYTSVLTYTITATF